MTDKDSEKGEKGGKTDAMVLFHFGSSKIATMLSLRVC